MIGYLAPSLGTWVTGGNGTVRLLCLKYRNQIVIHIGLSVSPTRILTRTDNDLESGWQYKKRECRNTVTPAHAKTNGNFRKQKVVCGVWTISRRKREKYAYRARIKRGREQAR